MIYIELFLTFFLIGMFTIGGGYSMLPLIQNQVVAVHGWIDDTTFTDIVAISQMTPGPIGINSATYIGYEVLLKSGASESMSILGSFTATFAVVLPSFIIVLLLCKVYETWKNHPVFRGVMSGLRPAVIGLIALRFLRRRSISFFTASASFSELGASSFNCLLFIVHRNLNELIECIFIS